MSDQPKPGEWTTLNAVDQAELRSLREKVMELEQQLAAAEKALSEEVDCVHKTLMQLADEREQSARNVSALAKAHQQQLAAEREKHTGECKCEREHGFAWNPDCPVHQPKPTSDRFVMKDHALFDTQADAFIGAGDACYLLNEAQQKLQ